MSELEKEFYPLGAIVTLRRHALGTTEPKGAILGVVEVEYEGEDYIVHTEKRVFYSGKALKGVFWEWVYNPNNLA